MIYFSEMTEYLAEIDAIEASVDGDFAGNVIRICRHALPPEHLSLQEKTFIWFTSSFTAYLLYTLVDTTTLETEDYCLTICCGLMSAAAQQLHDGYAAQVRAKIAEHTLSERGGSVVQTEYHPFGRTHIDVKQP